MKLQTIFIILIISLLTPSLSYAIATPKDCPATLIFNKKPIDTLCIYEAVNMDYDVNLQNCGVTAEKGRRIVGYNMKLINEGFIGYNYLWTFDEQAESSQGYSYYKIFGKTNNSYVVYAINDGGGSGKFSSLNLINRQDDHIHVKNIRAGDRCNNGIFNVSLKNQTLTYSVNLTSFDFLDLSNDNPHNLKAYDDLDDCASCCKAAAVFERNLDNDFLNEKFLYVDLKAYPNDDNDDYPGENYQKCFDQLLQSYINMGKTKLDSNELKIFTSMFNSKCLKKN